MSPLEGSRPGAQLPNAKISAGSQREAIHNGLTTPVLQNSMSAVGFRLLWRATDEQTRETEWKKILSHRMRCDDLIKGVHGVAFFVSAVSGVISRRPKPALPTTSPTVAYWVVFQSHSVDPRCVTSMLQNSLRGTAELKFLQELPVINNAEVINGTLCAVLKDHGSSYVYSKMTESYNELKTLMPVSMGNPVRLVTAIPGFENLLGQAQQLLKEANILLDIV